MEQKLRDAFIFSTPTAQLDGIFTFFIDMEILPDTTLNTLKIRSNNYPKELILDLEHNLDKLKVDNSCCGEHYFIVLEFSTLNMDFEARIIEGYSEY